MHNIPLITTIAAAFAGAWVLGLLTQRLGLSPIVGYLLAGVCIGPYTPGFVGDVHLAQQLAEIGVILLMFGVGLHFHLKDLLAVKYIAVPGALVQSAAATGLGALAAWEFGWPLSNGLVLGVAMAVASTVVLMRVLMDHHMLQTSEGHVAVGWLVVEDLLTVLVLVMMPVLAGQGDAAGGSVWLGLGWTLGKLLVLALLFGFVGRRVIPWIMMRVANLQSRELFTLTVLVMAITLATGSAYFFGASMALGAFLAGMVVGQSPVSHQAAADALPMRDAFAVLFFVSVGMMFDPHFLMKQPKLIAVVLGIVLVGKPLAALGIVMLLGHPLRTGLTVALGLAQIGEFSFILAEEARGLHLLPEDGYHVLVATAIFSITLNPLLFRGLFRVEHWVGKRPRLARLLSGSKKRRAMNLESPPLHARAGAPLAVVVGYGPVGQTVIRLLREAGWNTMVIDANLENVLTVRKEGGDAIFGDASNRAILEQSGLNDAACLVVTLPHSTNRLPLVELAREINEKLRVLVRARYVQERTALAKAGADWICVEEEEAAVGLAEAVLREVGAPAQEAQKGAIRVRDGFQTTG